MSVSNADFVTWLGKVQAENAQYVSNAREEGLAGPDFLYVGRAVRKQFMMGGIKEFPGTWGNPYRESDVGRMEAVRKFVIYVGKLSDQERREFLKPIREAIDSGKTLRCWCAPLVCHAHVLAGWARAMDFSVEPEPDVQPKQGDAALDSTQSAAECVPAVDTAKPMTQAVPPVAPASRFASSRA